MCFPKPPSEPAEAKAARQAKLREEQERARELKEKTLDKRKGDLSGAGSRSLITSDSGSGYGRNFF